MTPEPSFPHSPDGAWWWDGARWLPAWTPDRRYWFDGVGWRSARRQWSARAKRYLVAWLGTLLLIFVVTWALVGLGTSNVGTRVAALSVAAGASLVSGLMTGYVLGREGLGRLVPIAALSATGLLMACYVASFIFGSGDVNADNEAGAGTVFFAIPTFATTAFILGLGWIAGNIFRRRTPAATSA